MSETVADHGVLVLNPASGGGDHADAVRKRATLADLAVRETAAAGDAADLAEDAAAEGASLIAAAGGDGTLQEVVRGVTRAEALDRVTVAVVPAGTGNNFASNVGIGSLDAAFAAIEDGRRRRIDLGWANDRPFVNSCVGGLTADASGATTPEMKDRLGVLAYLLSTLRSVASFERLDLTVAVGPDRDDTDVWSGRAIAVLAGNARRFTPRGSRQANVEDGLLEVTVIEDVSALDLVEEASLDRVVSDEFEHATSMRSSRVTVRLDDADEIAFSLDGEIVEVDRLSLETQPRSLRMVVGESYRPDPDAS